jgi:hypothetical protein
MLTIEKIERALDIQMDVYYHAQESGPFEGVRSRDIYDAGVREIRLDTPPSVSLEGTVSRGGHGPTIRVFHEREGSYTWSVNTESGSWLDGGDAPDFMSAIKEAVQAANEVSKSTA